MARTLPTVGLAPIDVYLVGDRPCGYFEHVVNCGSGEEWHGAEIVGTPTFSASSSSYVGQNIVVTTAGTSAVGMWLAGIYAKAVQGTTKNVAGYMCGAELEVSNSADNEGAMACLVCNFTNNTTQTPNAMGCFFHFNSYGSVEPRSFMYFPSAQYTVGSDGNTTSLLSANNPAAVTHTIRFLIGSTPYWIHCSNTVV